MGGLPVMNNSAERTPEAPGGRGSGTVAEKRENADTVPLQGALHTGAL